MLTSTPYQIDAMILAVSFLCVVLFLSTKYQICAQAKNWPKKRRSHNTELRHFSLPLSISNKIRSTQELGFFGLSEHGRLGEQGSSSQP
jgi:hypothetical protein